MPYQWAPIGFTAEPASKHKATKPAHRPDQPKFRKLFWRLVKDSFDDFLVAAIALACVVIYLAMVYGG